MSHPASGHGRTSSRTDQTSAAAHTVPVHALDVTTVARPHRTEPATAQRAEHGSTRRRPRPGTASGLRHHGQPGAYDGTGGTRHNDSDPLCLARTGTARVNTTSPGCGNGPAPAERAGG